MKLSAPLPNHEAHYLNSPELLARTKTLVLEERRATVALIEHLEEIQTRMLYAELGYSSLWEFATRELGLSEGAAQRRIQAMRLVRDVPEAKEKLESGLLSLSNAAKVQSFRQAEKKQGRKPDPKALITQVESLSQKECEKVLHRISPESFPVERERIVSAEGAREIKFIVDAKLYEKLEHLKGLLAHSKSSAGLGVSYADLIEYMADLSLQVIAKKKGLTTATFATSAAAAVEAQKPLATVNSNSAHLGKTVVLRKLPLPVSKRISIPAALKRAVWSKAQGQCQIVVNNRRCTSSYLLEIDHITPLALGGSNAVSNLRLVCRPHNQLNLIGNLGESK